MLVDFITDNHKSTKRNYEERMKNDKVACSIVARRFNKEFFDGDRKYGYGGYREDGRWKSVAKKIVEQYGINENSRVLDIGCGKGFLAYELIHLTGCSAEGCDISEYALSKSKVKSFKFNAGTDVLKKHYDLIISINTLHNLILPNLKQAIEQIVEHSDFSYISVESYRNTQELHNLQCWALTCEQFLRPEEWEFLFKEWHYKRDWEFIYFE